MSVSKEELLKELERQTRRADLSDGALHRFAAKYGNADEAVQEDMEALRAQLARAEADAIRYKKKAEEKYRKLLALYNEGKTKERAELRVMRTENYKKLRAIEQIIKRSRHAKR